MKFKKTIMLVLVLMLGVLILAGCGDDDKDDNVENATLAGKWVHSWGSIYEFNEDGTGVWRMGENSDAMNFIYEDKGDTLVITYRYEDVLGDGPGDGYFYEDPMELKYSIKGNKLSVQESNSDDMAEYEKN